MAVNDVSFDQHAVIEFPVKNNCAAFISDRLCHIYGDFCMGACSVQCWMKHFKNGNRDITHLPCNSYARSAITEYNEQKFHVLITEE
jgi:hypothetical protein